MVRKLMVRLMRRTSLCLAISARRRLTNFLPGLNAGSELGRHGLQLWSQIPSAGLHHGKRRCCRRFTLWPVIGGSGSVNLSEKLTAIKVKDSPGF
jgi:hypothetical protein